MYGDGGFMPRSQGVPGFSVQWLGFQVAFGLISSTSCLASPAFSHTDFILPALYSCPLSACVYILHYGCMYVA